MEKKKKVVELGLTTGKKFLKLSRSALVKTGGTLGKVGKKVRNHAIKSGVVLTKKQLLLFEKMNKNIEESADAKNPKNSKAS